MDAAMRAEACRRIDDLALDLERRSPGQDSELHDMAICLIQLSRGLRHGEASYFRRVLVHAHVVLAERPEETASPRRRRRVRLP